MTTLERLTDILAEHLGFAHSDIRPDTLFVELGADSLDHVEIVMACEEEFGIDIPDDAIVGLEPHTIQALTDALDKAIAEQKS